MLTKLRNRFFLLMTGFSVIFLTTAFTAVYAVSYFKTTSEINEKLNFTEVLEINTDKEVSLGGEKTTALVVSRVFPNLGVYFNLIVDKNGKILVIDSALELPADVYEKVGFDAWTHNNRQTVKFSDRLWRYKITPSVTQIIIDNGSSSDHTETDETYQIRFLDVTESMESLNTLRNTLLLTGFILLLVFFFMSLYFSNRAVKPMQAVWDNQQRFLGDASHELKTPLSIITANIGVLYANKEETVESQIKWLDYILNGTKRMSGLVQNMLTLSKIETENTFSIKAPVNISSTIAETVNSFEAAANDKNINIEKNISENISATTYTGLIEQVIYILVDNAVRYTPSGGIISIKLYKEKSAAVLTVQNNGAGIPKEDLPKIFDRFFRSDISRTNSGDSFGLGLPIAKSAVDRLGGKIEAESTENEKTTFTVKIPL